MEIFKTPGFTKLLKTLAKPKYTYIYGTIKKEIDGFFIHYSSFEDVWNKNYMLYENSFIRVNKVRLENELQNSGKSGGFRMIIICDKRSESVGLLYVYPKIGPLQMETTNLEFTKNLVKDYSKAKADSSLEIFNYR